MHLNQLRENLIKQTFPIEIIENGFRKACNNPQRELRKPRKPKLDDNIPFILTHNYIYIYIYIYIHNQDNHPPPPPPKNTCFKRFAVTYCIIQHFVTTPSQFFKF